MLNITTYKPTLGKKAIEPMIVALVGHGHMPPFDVQFVNDMSNHYWSGHSFTTKQIDVCVKILNKHKSYFVPDLMQDDEYDHVISEVICERTPRVSKEYPSEIRYVGKNILALRAKYSTQMHKVIKRLNNEQGLPSERTYFDREITSLWYIHVTEANLDLIMKLIKDFKIGFDDSVVAFIAQCTDAKILPSEVQVDGDQVNIIVRNDPLLQYWLDKHISWTEDV